MLLAEQDDQAGGLGVEGAGDVQDSGIDKLLDLAIGDRAVLAELIDSTAGLSCLDESFGGRHGGMRRGEKSARSCERTEGHFF